MPFLQTVCFQSQKQNESVQNTQTLWADSLNAVYFCRGLTCTLGLTNDLIDGGQPRAKNGF